MTSERAKFAGGDQQYLRDEQYADSTRLTARADIHSRYRTAAVGWFDWVMARLDLSDGDGVLEVGCGAGWLWSTSTAPVPADVHLTLSDLSPGMVDEAVQRVRSGGRLAAVHGRPADLQHLPFEDDSFDVVIANHMLYHLPEPGLGVAELARVVEPDGHVIVATNGRRHMRELWALRGEVFGTPTQDQTIDVFGIETGFPMLRDHFAEVAWTSFDDVLRVTEPADAMAYICSTPPGEDATPEQRGRLASIVDAAFADGRGVLEITKDTGVFRCTPRR